MPFDFVCPFCHSRIRVDDRYAGLSGPCAECGKRVTMPGRPKLSATDASAATLARSHPAGSQQPGHAFSLKTSRLRSLAIYSLLAGTTLAIFLLAFIFLLPTARQAFALRQRTIGLSNAKQIADALNAYRRTYGSYPTPIVVDSAGKDLYSWRVLILPQLGYSSLYDDYQLDQPWDSPTNLSLVMKMPQVYACPNNPAALGMHETNFALIVGPGSLFPIGSYVDPDKMIDNPSETLLVVETLNNGFVWSQPGDLDTGRGLAIGTRPMRDIGGNYPECALAVTVDGTPLSIKSTISASLLDAIVSPNGGESVDLSSICHSSQP